MFYSNFCLNLSNIYQNNLSITLAPEPALAECQVDADCPPRTACIDSSCQDPCRLRPCHPDQTCSVEDTLPIRTVVCSCPPDTFIGPDGSCKPKGKQFLPCLYLNRVVWLLVAPGRLILVIHLAVTDNQPFNCTFL